MQPITTMNNTLRPTILVIHGAWHNPEFYDPFCEILEDHGYKTVCPHLPTCQNDVASGKKLLDDIIIIRTTARTLLERGETVVAVMHSYGGVEESDSLIVSDPTLWFFNDLPPQAAVAWAKKLVAHPRSAQFDRITNEAYRNIPTTYISKRVGYKSVDSELSEIVFTIITAFNSSFTLLIFVHSYFFVMMKSKFGVVTLLALFTYCLSFPIASDGLKMVRQWPVIDPLTLPSSLNDNGNSNGVGNGDLDGNKVVFSPSIISVSDDKTSTKDKTTASTTTGAVQGSISGNGNGNGLFNSDLDGNTVEFAPALANLALRSLVEEADGNGNSNGLFNSDLNGNKFDIEPALVNLGLRSAE
ncbi:Alpha/beta hydrolase fold-1 [Penicillium angulare]|uniref:Alpha/beta hydrolase fold-1 n=1 Tax=Penicillium angulare TaxID=116970 RepID=A0A9W9FXT6_9EURO|nr:Alpha/beta hydrolase fold-1 [Penicillium angulare]